MAEVICPGLPASWLNAWLAAVGTTVLDSRIRLRWTTDSTPRAVLCAEGVDPVEALAASWPDRDELADLPIAEHWKDTPPMPRKVSVGAFAARARAARGHRCSWTLSSTMTDLSVDDNREVAHAPVRSGRARNHQVAAPSPAEGAPRSRAVHRTPDGLPLRHSRTRQGQRAGVRPDQDGIAVRCLRHDSRSGRRSAGVLRPCAVARARRRHRPERP